VNLRLPLAPHGFIAATGLTLQSGEGASSSRKAVTRPQSGVALALGQGEQRLTRPEAWLRSRTNGRVRFDEGVSPLRRSADSMRPRTVDARADSAACDARPGRRRWDLSGSEIAGALFGLLGIYLIVHARRPRPGIRSVRGMRLMGGIYVLLGIGLVVANGH
jgi:hypothetical protein